MRKLLFFLGLLFPLVGQCATLPAPSLSSSVGVNIHLNNFNSPSDYALMAAAGVKVARTDLKWSDIETTLGSYSGWTPYDTMVTNMVQNGIRPYLILDYSNSLYEGADSSGATYAPQHPSSVTAYVNWVKAVVAHFNDPTLFPTNPQIIWEIWNEPNNGPSWVQDPSLASPGGAMPTRVSQYITLASATCSAIKTVDHNATVVGPALLTLTQSYMASLLSSGILSCLDAVSVHPYRGTPPESIVTDTPAADQLNYQSLRSLIDVNTPGGRGPIPILSGEWGYGSTLTFGQTQQAQDLVRMQLINLYSGIPISVWYDWKDDGTNLLIDDQNYGLVGNGATSTPKTSYTALKTLTTELSGYEYQSKIPMSDAQDYALLFKNAAGKYRMVMWTTDLAHLVAPNPTGTPFTPTTVVGMTGTRSSLPSLLGIPASVLLSTTPQYIE